MHRPTISLDGKHFQITTNLYALLKEFRCCDTRAGPFWADAICINQSDDLVKSKQVSIMAKICRKTERCIVWLGAEEEEMEEAFRLFPTSADRANENVLRYNCRSKTIDCREWNGKIGRAHV